MVFSSLIFIFIFLPLTLLFYYTIHDKYKNHVLLIFSLIFYAWGEPIYIIVMVFSIIFNYLGALVMNKCKTNKFKKRFYFILIITLNILLLGFFKYFNFIVANINGIFHRSFVTSELPLPVGISFYTFQILSYIIDLYHDKIPVQKSLVNFSTYVVMFPQLVAGPIVSYSKISLELLHRKVSILNFGHGIERFIIGLSKKVLVANNLGAVWMFFKAQDFAGISVLGAWLGITCFSLQIYFDFSGYSDMALGLGEMLGFNFDENFNYPYISKSISEFWRRWHISLGSWFREYIYIPLGGNRVSKLRQFLNLFIVWFITGLWHGANWNFVCWGLYFGIFIFIEKIFLKPHLERHTTLSHIYTLVIVICSWVIFDSNTMKDALLYLRIMLGLSGNAFINRDFIYYFYTNFLLLTISVLLCTPVIRNKFIAFKERFNMRGVFLLNFLLIFIFILTISYLVNESFNPFLYFRF